MSKSRYGNGILKFALLSVAVTILPLAAKAHAHGPLFAGYGAYSNCGWGGATSIGGTWGSYGMGGGFHRMGSCFPSYSFTSYSGFNFGLGFPHCSGFYGGYGHSPFLWNSAVCPPIVYSPICYQRIRYRATPVIYQPSIPLGSIATKANVAKVAYAPSTGWAQEAIGLIDQMSQKGGSAEGFVAGKQLMTTQTDLPGHFYTRMAVLAAMNNAESSEVLEYLALAKQYRADPKGSDLPGGSIRAFVATLPKASMDGLMNQIALKALTKPNGRKPEFQILASLLVMDGQVERATRFKDAVDRPSNEPSIDRIDSQALALAN